MEEAGYQHDGRRYEDLHGEQRRKFFRFDPTVSTGTLITLATLMVSFGIAYGTYREDQAKRDAQVEAIKVQAAVDRSAITQLGSDIKELKGDVSEIGKNVTVIKVQREMQMQQQARQPAR